MKKFIKKTSFFVVPFIILYFINIQFYKKGEGDLVRLGFIYHNPSPFTQTLKQFEALPLKYSLISEIDLDKETPFDILTIGDSFSEQGEYGYQNPLAYKGLSVGHIDRFLSNESPVQNLVSLINSDFFDYVKPKYVVLQTVQRSSINRSLELSFSEKKDIDSIKRQIKEHNENPNDISIHQKERLDFFSDATVKIPLMNIQYLFLKRPFKSNIYRFKSNNTNLFTHHPDNLLFFKDDLRTLPNKNDINQVKKLNDNLNKISSLLSKKNIRLMVLISPDKYDLYYPYIKNKTTGKEPLFFEHLEKLKKDYIYIPSYSALSEALKKDTDIYFYDDTHWTYKGSKVVAEEIHKVIKKEDK